VHKVRLEHPFWFVSQEKIPQIQYFIQECVEMSKHNPALYHHEISNHPLIRCNVQGIASLHGVDWLCSEVITSFLHAVYEVEHVQTRCILAPAHMYAAISDSGPRHKSLNNFTEMWTLNDMLEKEIIVPIHHQSHWMLGIIVPKTYHIYLIDSYGKERNQIVKNLHKFYCHQLNLKEFTGIQKQLSHWTVVQGKKLPTNMPKQTDNTSCGIFASMAGLYWMEKQRFPTTDDYTQEDIPLLRLFMGNVILIANRMTKELLQ
jgi:hypothetical protein